MTTAKDWAETHVNGTDIHALADLEWSKVNKVHPPLSWRECVFSATILQRKTFAPIKYVVEGLLPDGLSLLVGRPKIGKSWLALDTGLAVASQEGTCNSRWLCPTISRAKSAWFGPHLCPPRI